MRKITGIVVVAISFLLTGCSDNQKPQNVGAQTDAKLETVVDSTEMSFQQLEQQEVENMVEIINSVSQLMDSIQVQENLIFNLKEDTPKELLVAKLKSFKDLLAQKQERIEKLKVQNGSNKAALVNLQKMVDFMKAEIVAKNKQVEQLQELVEKKDVSISALRYSLNALQQESDYLNDQNFKQDQQLNAIYYIIGEKSELKEKGMLKGGFLSKKRADYTNLDKNQFTKRDKRGFTKLKIDAKSPKLITEKPESSYTLTANEDGTSILEITNIDAFWSGSPFLIIQK